MTGNTDQIFANKALSEKPLKCRLKDYCQKHASKPKAKRKNEIISEFIHDVQLLWGELRFKISRSLEQFAKMCSRWSEKILAGARRCDGVDRHPRLSDNAAMDKRFRSFRSLGEAANFPHLTPTTGYRFEQNAPRCGMPSHFVYEIGWQNRNAEARRTERVSRRRVGRHHDFFYPRTKICAFLRALGVSAFR